MFAMRKVADYVGRQPELIEADNFVPLFADSDFCMTETLRPRENGEPPGLAASLLHGAKYPLLGSYFRRS